MTDRVFKTAARSAQDDVNSSGLDEKEKSLLTAALRYLDAFDRWGDVDVRISYSTTESGFVFSATALGDVVPKDEPTPAPPQQLARAYTQWAADAREAAEREAEPGRQRWLLDEAERLDGLAFDERAKHAGVTRPGRS